MSNWFVLFVQTGKEEIISSCLNKLLYNHDIMAFVPKVEYIYSNQRYKNKEVKPMFPGYVFAETSCNRRNFLILVTEIIRWSRSIYRLLGNNDFNFIELYENEKKFLLQFCDERHVVRDSIGYIVGDKVFITSGPLYGKESTIKKINRHKRQAIIELDFMGDTRLVSVALEIVSKIK